jgi:hypothetical protein
MAWKGAVNVEMCWIEMVPGLRKALPLCDNSQTVLKFDNVCARGR